MEKLRPSEVSRAQEEGVYRQDWLSFPKQKAFWMTEDFNRTYRQQWGNRHRNAYRVYRMAGMKLERFYSPSHMFLERWHCFLHLNFVVTSADHIEESLKPSASSVLPCQQHSQQYRENFPFATFYKCKACRSQITNSSDRRTSIPSYPEKWGESSTNI